MTDLQSTQAVVLTVAGGGGSLSASSVWGLVIVNRPSQEVRAAAAQALLPLGRSGADDFVRVSQVVVMAVVRGLPDWPVSRAWTYTLDGHDYYVLTTMDETFVCDLSVDPPAWSVYGSGDLDKWRAWVGRQWNAALPFEEAYGSNVLAGDSATGTLYFLNPAKATDDDPDFSVDDQRPFKRVVTGQVMIRGNDYVDCPGVLVSGSVGELLDDTLTGVELFTSDDKGHSYTSHGTVDVQQGDYEARMDWLSLGAMSAPGRLFRVVDYGALTRVDDLEMPDNGVSAAK